MDKSRQCTICQEYKKIEDFVLNNYEYYTRQCRKCLNMLHRKRAQEDREKLQKIKEASPCTDCKIFYPHYVLEYDHIDKTKKKNGIALMVGRWNFKHVLEEIKKCELVCSNCYRIREYKRGFEHFKASYRR